MLSQTVSHKNTEQPSEKLPDHSVSELGKTQNTGVEAGVVEVRTSARRPEIQWSASVTSIQVARLTGVTDKPKTCCEHCGEHALDVTRRILTRCRRGSGGDRQTRHYPSRALTERHDVGVRKFTHHDTCAQ